MFKQLLELSNEANAEHVTEDKLIQLLKGPYHDSHEAAKRMPIYAHLISDEPYFEVDPQAKSRKSKFFLDKVMPLLPSWHGYALRTSSARGWTDAAEAEKRGEGNLYVLMPSKGAKICVAPGLNFYKGFEAAAKALGVQKLDNEGLISWVHEMYKQLHKHNLTKEQPPVIATLEQLLNKLNKLKKLVKSEHYDKIQNVGYVKLTKATDAISFLNDLLSPDANGYVQHMSAFNLPEKREVWTGAKCLCISVDEYQKLASRGIVK